MATGFFILSVHMTTFYIMILVEDIVLCLSIILKWNKYFVKHNYLMLYWFK